MSRRAIQRKQQAGKPSPRTSSLDREVQNSSKLPKIYGYNTHPSRDLLTTPTNLILQSASRENGGHMTRSLMITSKKVVHSHEHHSNTNYSSSENGEDDVMFSIRPVSGRIPLRAKLPLTLPKLSNGNRSGHNERHNNQKSNNEAVVMSQQNKQLRDMTPSEQLDFLNSQMIGRSLIIETCFGPKLKLYLDYTASGQELRFVIDIMTRVEDYYANTHTETSATGAYMNNLLNEAEAEILKACKASEKDYFVVGGGSGSTFAIEMAQKYLGTYLPPATRENLMKLFPTGTRWEDIKAQLRQQNQLPLVIVSHYEHHSNEVTWRNQLCDVEECPPRLDGHIDLDHLETLLKRYKHRVIIGSLSAGSNVSGLKTDVFAVASTLKKYGAMAFFDFAAVGPYVAIDLSKRTKDGICLIDGIYLSPHKFLGGPGSCGILIFNKHVYNNKLEPSHGGGGTVDYVGRKGQLFTDEPNHREKSGTPGILQIIKAALAIQLKSILQTVIETRENYNLNKFYAVTSTLRNLQLVGPHLEEYKVGIMSFLIHHNNGPKGRRYLHQNLIVRLLNDVFGIQGRSGCSCAGPYGHYLLNIDDETSEKFRFWIEKHPDANDRAQLSGFKPGWARINLHYTLTDWELDYLLFALSFLCDYGHRFLSCYTFDPFSGQWKHVSEQKNNPHPNVPIFGFESLMADHRQYAESEKHRQKLFEQQRKEAFALIDRIPPLTDLDSIPEMPYCFFYVEKDLLLHRKLIQAKAKVYEKHYGGIKTPASVEVPM